MRHPGVRGWGNSGWLQLRLRLWMTCTTFGSSVSVFVHLRVLNPARVSNSFKHFDFIFFTTHRGIMHNAFASSLLIPLHWIFFRSRLDFFDGSA